VPPDQQLCPYQMLTQTPSWYIINLALFWKRTNFQLISYREVAMEQVMEETKTKTLMTAEELLRLSDDGLRYELVKSDLFN
jgi:hypothetical protein